MTSPRTLLSAWDIRAKKEFGQNFLEQPAIVKKIVDSAQLEADDTVLEIGAGLGMLTIAAARCVKNLLAVEKDARLIPLLKAELLASGVTNVRVLEKDALDIDISSLAETAQKPVVVLGNLPYNISSQIIVKLILERRAVARAILMLQRELAERIASRPGVKQYGRLTVMLQYCAIVKPLFHVAACQFFPKPKVDSSIVAVEFTPQIPYPANDEDLLFRVVKLAFGKRRKTLRNALSGSGLGMDTRQTAAVLMHAGIDPMRRAETLSVSEFVHLSNCVGEYFDTGK